jgi:hypothetical protein
MAEGAAESYRPCASGRIVREDEQLIAEAPADSEGEPSWITFSRKISEEEMRLVRYLFNMLFATSLTVTSVACCKTEPQPTHPGKVGGWNIPREKCNFCIAILVLKKGEKSDNGKIGVEVLDISAPRKPCAWDSVYSYPTATLRFYDAINQQTLCEESFFPGIINVKCASTPGVYSVSINSINTLENWVYFDMRGAPRK